MHRSLASPLVLVAGTFGLLVAEALLARRGEGAAEPAESPSMVVGPELADPLVFVVLGDSAGAGVGAETQDQGYPRACARFLSGVTGRRVELHVLAVSGARVADLRRDQLPAVAALRPELVLLEIGGNDVVNLTPPWTARRNLAAVLDELAATPARVVVSGIPDMTLPRVWEPLRSITSAMGRYYDGIWRDETWERGMVRVELAAETGKLFHADNSLFSEDGFHPGPRGYAAWADAFERGIERAFRPAR